MSVAVSKILDAYEIDYQTEVPNTVFPEIVSLGVDVKRFDFVIKMICPRFDGHLLT